MVGVAARCIRGVEVLARPQCLENRRGAPDVVVMGMREHECLDASASPAHIRHHCAAPRIAALPDPPGIEQYPATRWSSERQRIALTHVDHVQLDTACRVGERRKPCQDGERCHGNDDRPCGKPSDAGEHDRGGKNPGEHGGGQCRRHADRRVWHRRSCGGDCVEQREQWVCRVGDEAGKRLQRCQHEGEEQHRLGEAK
jgi:hypothetical protein